MLPVGYEPSSDDGVIRVELQSWNDHHDMWFTSTQAEFTAAAMRLGELDFELTTVNLGPHRVRFLPGFFDDFVEGFYAQDDSPLVLAPAAAALITTSVSGVVLRPNPATTLTGTVTFPPLDGGFPVEEVGVRGVPVDGGDLTPWAHLEPTAEEGVFEFEIHQVVSGEPYLVLVDDGDRLYSSGFFREGSVTTPDRTLATRVVGGSGPVHVSASGTVSVSGRVELPSDVDLADLEVRAEKLGEDFFGNPWWQTVTTASLESDANFVLEGIDVGQEVVVGLEDASGALHGGYFADGRVGLVEY